jgi:Domain of unknown function (DUF397)
MRAIDLPPAGELPWRTARLCDASECIRVAHFAGTIVLGDSKNPDGPVLTASRQEWTAFLARIKNGHWTTSG